ncbi:MAG: hypothetical protein HGA67_00935 [Candidatus Yonathbacteria bacterium]|nr:hypothetical protein [Candidatus Yonathbacteria bacterium]
MSDKTTKNPQKTPQTEAEKILYILNNYTISKNNNEMSDFGEIVAVKNLTDGSGFLIYTKTSNYLVDGSLFLRFYPSECRFKDALHLIVYKNNVETEKKEVPPISVDETVLIEGPPAKIQKLVEYLGLVYLA